MASVLKVLTKNGTVRWVVTLHRLDLRFRLTFDNRPDACTWAEENEAKFVEDPESYFEWRKLLCYKMCRENNGPFKGIIRPKLRKVKHGTNDHNSGC